MKSKAKERSTFDSVKNPPISKHTHYFHADEDFREDRDWGKTETIEFPDKQDTSKIHKKRA